MTEILRFLLRDKGLLSVHRGRRRPGRFVEGSGPPPPPPGPPILLADWAGATTGNAALIEPPQPNPQVPIFAPNIQSGPLGNAKQFTVVSVEQANRARFVTSPLRQGTHALRLECRPGDFEQVTYKERVQLATWRAPKTFIPMYEDIWTSISLYLDPAIVWPTWASGDWRILYQHWGGASSGEGAGSPPVSIALNYHQQFYMHIMGGEKAGLNTAEAYSASHYFGPNPATTGIYHDFLIHTVIDYIGIDGYTDNTGVWRPGGGTGLTEVWHREMGGSFPGTPQVTERRPNAKKITADGKLHGYWPALPIYRSNIPEVDVVHVGGIIIGPDRATAEALWA